MGKRKGLKFFFFLEKLVDLSVVRDLLDVIK